MKSRVIEERSLFKNRWTELVEVKYHDEEVKVRKWEALHRMNRSPAVVVVPQLLPSGRYVLIRQFRPPTGQYVVEFPAGLIDAQEEIENAAIRELREETGYVGAVDSVTPALYSSPGLLSEACHLAFVTIDETLMENRSPRADNEPGEFIEVFLKKPEEILPFLNAQVESGVGVDIKLHTYFSSLGAVCFVMNVLNYV